MLPSIPRAWDMVEGQRSYDPPFVPLPHYKFQGNALTKVCLIDKVCGPNARLNLRGSSCCIRNNTNENKPVWIKYHKPTAQDKEIPPNGKYCSRCVSCQRVFGDGPSRRCPPPGVITNRVQRLSSLVLYILHTRFTLRS